MNRLRTKVLLVGRTVTKPVDKLYREGKDEKYLIFLNIIVKIDKIEYLEYY